MRVVPQAFYTNPGIRKVLVDGLCAVIEKSAEAADRENERYLATHALTVVLDGELQIESHDGDFTRVGTHQMVFLPRGLYFISDIIPKDGPFRALVFFFDEELVGRSVDGSGTNNAVAADASPMVMPYAGNIRLFAENLVQLYATNDPNRHGVTRAKLQELLHLLLRSDHGPAFQNRLTLITQREKKSVSAFMAANFDKPLSIADYAYLTGRSLSTFHRDFKRVFDTAPKKWLTEKRLEKARELLATGNHSVMDTARAVGFGDPVHFSKVFRKKFGQAPKQFGLLHRGQVAI